MRRCELNYVYSNYIAEFWNTLSSIPIVIFGAWATFNSLRYSYEIRFLIPSVLLTLVGLGSIFFHGTLLYAGQALDELTMIYCATSLLYVVLETEAIPRRKWLAPALLAYNAAFTVVYLTLPSRAYFSFFVLTFIALCIGAFLQAVRLYNRTVDSRLRPLFWLGAGLFLFSFLCLWVPDNLFCRYTRACCVYLPDAFDARRCSVLLCICLRQVSLSRPLAGCRPLPAARVVSHRQRHQQLLVHRRVRQIGMGL